MNSHHHLPPNEKDNQISVKCYAQSKVMVRDSLSEDVTYRYFWIHIKNSNPTRTWKKMQRMWETMGILRILVELKHLQRKAALLTILPHTLLCSIQSGGLCRSQGWFRTPGSLLLSANPQLAALPAFPASRALEKLLCEVNNATILICILF